LHSNASIIIYRTLSFTSFHASGCTHVQRQGNKLELGFYAHWIICKLIQIYKLHRILSYKKHKYLHKFTSKTYKWRSCKEILSLPCLSTISRSVIVNEIVSQFLSNWSVYRFPRFTVIGYVWGEKISKDGISNFILVLQLSSYIGKW
jgi:hypothetical protein